MKKTSMIICIVFAILAAISGVLVVGMIDYRNKMTARSGEVYNFPDCMLSQDVFEQQNTAYEPNEELGTTVVLKGDKYYIDMYSVDSAQIENTTGYRINESTVISVTMVGKGEDTKNPFLKAVSAMLFPSADLNSFTAVDGTMVSGYKNGYSADYNTTELTYKDEEGLTKTAMVTLSYVVHLPSNDLRIAISVDNPSDDVLASAEQMLDDVFLTLRTADEEETNEDSTNNVIEQVPETTVSSDLGPVAETTAAE